MNDDYSHCNLSIIYIVENIPGPADSSKEFAHLLNEFNSQIADHCSCHQCTEDTCKCLQLSGGYNYKYSDNKMTFCLILNSKSNEARPIIECNDNCSCSDNCSNRLVQKGPLCGLVVNCCNIESKGLGLFTNNPIVKGAFICEYAGELITKSQAIMRHKTNMLTGKMNYIFCLNEHGANEVVQTFVDPSSFGNIGRYINHSCDPNTHIVPVRWNTPIPKLAIFAYRDIAAGEEITFHYGDHSVGDDTLECPSTSTTNNRKNCFCKSSICNGLMPYNAY